MKKCVQYKHADVPDKRIDKSVFVAQNCSAKESPRAEHHGTEKRLIVASS